MLEGSGRMWFHVSALVAPILYSERNVVDMHLSAIRAILNFLHLRQKRTLGAAHTEFRYLYISLFISH